MATAAATPTERVTSERLLLWTLLTVYIFNFLDRQIVTILAEPIKRDLGLSDTQLGLMTGLAFALFYALLGIPIARYADRPHSNRVGIISVSLVMWSAMTALCGMAQNFSQLLVARVGVGVGEAGCTPAAHSLISDMVPVERRASAIAFYGLGISIGGLMGMILGGFLADTIGWRRAFLFVGAPGVLLAIFVWFALRDPRGGSIAVALRAKAPSVPQLTARAALREVFSSRAYVMLAIAGGLVAFLSYGKGVWAAIFFIRTHGLTPGQTGLWLGLVAGIAALIGTWAGGWIADRYGRTNRRHMLTAPAVGLAVAAPILFLAYNATDWRMALVLLFVPTVLNALYYGPTYAIAQQLVRPEARAMATAIMVFAQNLIGLGLGPLFFGMMSDYFKPMAGEESVRWVLYGASWLGLIPAFFFWRASLHLNRELAAKA
ncbi:MFS transporter [Polymorphobacter glacialis]|uniref:MFS transporter n=1 Tax=Sandarakinorhabdus glacialis TaxID=1614636 RepID=A0A916ZHI2_9SPHN|nr:MFS transporter [Polymorphobacter glacialis]GGD98274.1 MFS transporter [Polymorphobacter glacialis]